MSHLTSEQIMEEIEKAFSDGSRASRGKCLHDERVESIDEHECLSSIYARLDVLEEAGRLECCTKIVQTRNVRQEWTTHLSASDCLQDTFSRIAR